MDPFYVMLSVGLFNICVISSVMCINVFTNRNPLFKSNIIRMMEENIFSDDEYDENNDSEGEGNLEEDNDLEEENNDLAEDEDTNNENNNNANQSNNCNDEYINNTELKDLLKSSTNDYIKSRNRYDSCEKLLNDIERDIHKQRKMINKIITNGLWNMLEIRKKMKIMVIDSIDKYIMADISGNFDNIVKHALYGCLRTSSFEDICMIIRKYFDVECDCDFDTIHEDSNENNIIERVIYNRISDFI